MHVYWILIACKFSDMNPINFSLHANSSVHFSHSFVVSQAHIQMCGLSISFAHFAMRRGRYGEQIGQSVKRFIYIHNHLIRVHTDYIEMNLNDDDGNCDASHFIRITNTPWVLCVCVCTCVIMCTLPYGYAKIRCERWKSQNYGKQLSNSHNLSP